jgi:kynurenine formamidase
VLVRLTNANGRSIGEDALRGIDAPGAAVLLHTGWSRHWGTDAYGGAAPNLAESGARWLAEAGARIVGIDTVNIDNAYDGGGDRPAHSILLAAGIPVLEHLTGLDDLPDTGARLHAVPPRVRNFGTFPVRAYAIIR